MKSVLLAAILSLALSCAWAEMRYIEIDSISNATVVKVKSLSDFEALISKNNVSTAFLHSSSGDLLIGVGGTYFSFPLKGYRTIDDFKRGEAAGFKNGGEYAEAISLGLPQSENYYFYKRNSFQSTADCLEAKKRGFPTSSEFYAAREKGFSKYDDYTEYLNYTRLGFKTREDWKTAEKRGFSSSSAFYDSVGKDFANSADYQRAKSLGLSTDEELKTYDDISGKIERIMAEKSIDKSSAIVYYHIQKLPKGEMSLQVLSNSLSSQYDANSPQIKKSIEIFTRDTSGYRRNYFSKDSVFSTSNLKQFFSSVDIRELGTYSSQTEIFKRNGNKKVSGAESNEPKKVVELPIPEERNESFGMFLKPIHARHEIRERADRMIFVCPSGTSVYSAMTGIVSSTGFSPEFGNFVIVDHPSGYKTFYGHLSAILCVKGQSVDSGTRIGKVGATGGAVEPSLRFSVYKNKAIVPCEEVMTLF